MLRHQVQPVGPAAGERHAESHAWWKVMCLTGDEEGQCWISAFEIQHCPSSSQTALGYLIGLQASSLMLAHAFFTEAFCRAVMEKRAPPGRPR
ncbi:hypothetical protein [Streptomyces sp. A5-4]|uniref:hypothetical protein n=1 Tax=Streptomyces sp. A5-4 TaxID=3384771 RepID=UPI003DA82295